MDLKKSIRNIQDFPKKGIVYRDITTLLNDAEALKYSIDKMVEAFEGKGITKIAGIESRGFIFGMAMAYKMNLPFITVRKKGKLPYKTIAESYQLEYGTDVIEIHQDAADASDKVLIVDDLLATGGTMEAAVKLIRKVGAEVAGISFLIDLAFLNGREKLKGIEIDALVSYDSE